MSVAHSPAAQLVFEKAALSALFHAFGRLAFPTVADALTLVAVLPFAAFASAGLVRATSAANRSASESSFEALPAARDFFV